MLVDLNGNVQPRVGSQPHWAMFAAFVWHPAIYNPMLTEIARLVNAAVIANPTRPSVDSRQAGEAVLSAMTSWWHGEFPRRFPNFPNGSQRGIFGMSLWNYLAQSAQVWSFSAIRDSHGYGASLPRDTGVFDFMWAIRRNFPRTVSGYYNRAYMAPWVSSP